MTSFKQPQTLFMVVSLIIFHCFQPIVSNHLTDFMHGFSAIFTLCTVWRRVYKETTQIQGSALRKIEGSPVLWTCEIQCAQHMISMEKQRFSSCPRTKLRCHTGHWALLEHSLDIVTCRTLLRRDPLCFHSCKQPLHVSSDKVSAFWAFSYERF